MTKGCCWCDRRKKATPHAAKSSFTLRNSARLANVDSRTLRYAPLCQQQQDQSPRGDDIGTLRPQKELAFLPGKSKTAFHGLVSEAGRAEQQLPSNQASFSFQADPRPQRFARNVYLFSCSTSPTTRSQQGSQLFPSKILGRTTPKTRLSVRYSSK